MKNIVFEERMYDGIKKEWAYYFMFPINKILEMFPKRFKSKKVVTAELCIHLPCEEKTKYEFGSLNGVFAYISLEIENEDGSIDYEWIDADRDWKNLDISEEEVLELLEFAMRKVFSFEEYWNSGLIIRDLCPFDDCVICDEIQDCIANTAFDTLENDDSYAELKEHAKQLYKCRI